MIIGIHDDPAVVIIMMNMGIIMMIVMIMIIMMIMAIIMMIMSIIMMIMRIHDDCDDYDNHDDWDNHDDYGDSWLEIRSFITIMIVMLWAPTGALGVAMRHFLFFHSAQCHSVTSCDFAYFSINVTKSNSLDAHSWSNTHFSRRPGTVLWTNPHDI